MASDGDELLGMILDSADGFLAERHDLARLRIGKGASGTVVDEAVWRQMVELGWIGLGLPEALDGAGLDLSCGAALCERLGRALLPEPFIASALLPGAVLAACPPGDHRDGLAAALASGAETLTLAWQERAGQVGYERPQTTLDHGRVTGRKLFVPMALPAMTCLVMAIEAGEPVIVAVAGDAPGVEASQHRMGDGSSITDLVMDAAPISRTVLASGTAALEALEVALGRATIALAAQLAGLAEGALALSLDYLRTRAQFGQPIGAFQALQHRSVDLYLAVELAKAAWRKAARLQEQAPGAAETVAAVSAAKTIANKAARDTAQAGVQFFGAMGFTEEADIGLYLRTALHWSSWLGGDIAQRRRFRAASRERLTA